MIYSIENNIVYSTIIKPSSSLVKIPIDLLCKSKININNLSAITFTWLKFDLELGEYIEDIENTTPFIVDVAGQIVEIQVGETLEFSSDEAGTFTIKTINEGVGNDSKEVIIHG